MRAMGIPGCFNLPAEVQEELDNRVREVVGFVMSEDTKERVAHIVKQVLDVGIEAMVLPAGMEFLVDMTGTGDVGVVFRHQDTKAALEMALGNVQKAVLMTQGLGPSRRLRT